MVFFLPLPDALIEEFLPLSGEPKEPTLLHVLRRTDDVVLTTYEHDYLFAAVSHRDTLVERLKTEHIYDLCRDLGLDINLVGTPGS